MKRGTHRARSATGLLAGLVRLRSRLGDARLQRWALGLACAGFAAGLYLSFRTLPPDIRLARWAPLALSTFVGVPSAVLLTVCETWLTARVAGTFFDWGRSAHVSVLSSAANMLPLPGGALVRVAALRQAGAAVRAGAAATILVALLWLGLAFAASGIGVRTVSSPLAVAFALIAAALIIASCIAIFHLSGSWTTVGVIVAIKTGIVVVDVWRMRWALAALGVNLSTGEALTFALSGVAGAAVSVVPAGLGVTEAVAALLAPLSTISSSAAFLAATLNRMAALALMIPLAVWVGRLVRPHTGYGTMAEEVSQSTEDP